MSVVKLAVVGGIGSGKTVVTRLLQAMDIPVYDCDSRAKKLMESDEFLRRGLVRYFGDECFSEDGKLNRKWLAARIFVDKDALRRVNELVHPCVKNDFLAWSEKQTCDIVAVETAILFESNMRDAVDKVLLVWADKETCLSRIEERNGLTRNQALNRMNNQMSVDELLLLSDYSVYNDGNSPIIPEIVKIIKSVRAAD